MTGEVLLSSNVSEICQMSFIQAPIVQALLPQDLNARVNFATKISDKISDVPAFMKLLLFSDETILHLDHG